MKTKEQLLREKTAKEAEIGQLMADLDYYIQIGDKQKEEITRRKLRQARIELNEIIEQLNRLGE